MLSCAGNAGEGVWPTSAAAVASERPQAWPGCELERQGQASGGVVGGAPAELRTTHAGSSGTEQLYAFAASIFMTSNDPR